MRMARKKGIATIGAGFPVRLIKMSDLHLNKNSFFKAVPFTRARIRFCVSAAHTKEMLDNSLQVFDKLGEHLAIKFNS